MPLGVGSPSRAPRSSRFRGHFHRSDHRIKYGTLSGLCPRTALRRRCHSWVVAQQAHAGPPRSFPKDEAEKRYGALPVAVTRCMFGSDGTPSKSWFLSRRWGKHLQTFYASLKGGAYLKFESETRAVEVAVWRIWGASWQHHIGRSQLPRARQPRPQSVRSPRRAHVRSRIHNFRGIQHAACRRVFTSTTARYRSMRALVLMAPATWSS